MVDLGSIIVGLVGYGLALLLLLFALFSLRDALRMITAAVDYDEQGFTRLQYYAFTAGFLVAAAIVAALTRWTLGSF